MNHVVVVFCSLELRAVGVLVIAMPFYSYQAHSWRFIKYSDELAPRYPSLHLNSRVLASIHPNTL